MGGGGGHGLSLLRRPLARLRRRVRPIVGPHRQSHSQRRCAILIFRQEEKILGCTHVEGDPGCGFLPVLDMRGRFPLRDGGCQQLWGRQFNTVADCVCAGGRKCVARHPPPPTRSSADPVSTLKGISLCPDGIFVPFPVACNAGIFRPDCGFLPVLVEGDEVGCGRWGGFHSVSVQLRLSGDRNRHQPIITFHINIIRVPVFAVFIISIII
jgi:hypothetical protein